MKENQWSEEKFTTCHWCGHDANPLSAESCDVCGRRLDRAIPDERKANKLGLTLPLRLLGVSSLVLLSIGGGYWFWNHQSPSSKPATEISRSSDIQIYRTMKDVPNVPAGVFSYASATTFAAISANGMNDAISKAYPMFQIRYTEPPQSQNPGSTSAIKMLINGEVSIAQSSRPLEDAEFSRAKERNLVLEQIPVAIDGIVFYVHPDLTIPGLSLDQVQDIYSGKVRNWRDVGGPDLPIVPFSFDPKAVASPKQALGDVAERMGQHVQIVRDFTEGIRRVAATPGAISFGGGLNIIGQRSIRLLSLAKARSNQYISSVTPAGTPNQQVFRDGTYPLTRRLFVIIRRDSSLEAQAGIAYANFFLSEEGQQIIEKAGFVRLY